MLELLPSSLRLTAIYGFVIAASVIVFGASVGRLVDTMGRISAARLSLAIQVSSSPTKLYRSLPLSREVKDWHLQWGNGFNR